MYEFTLTLNTEYDNDSEELMKIANQLSKDMRNEGIEEFSFAKTDIKNAKGTMVDWGNILVTLLSTDVLVTLIKTLHVYIEAKKMRSITVKTQKGEFTFVGYSEETVKNILELFKDN